jgi:hypothetical protein
MMKAIALVLAVMTSACVIESGPDGPDDPGPGSSSSSSSSSYENTVHLECNGDVLVDKVFTSKASCEDFAANNTFYCAGIKLSVGC